VVGVSRVVTSEGWRPHKQQVGQTGTKITRSSTWPAASAAPSIQHIAGCAGARHIIAINTDPVADAHRRKPRPDRARGAVPRVVAKTAAHP
jgi:electron transfer flavoprotein alpha subunit